MVLCPPSWSPDGWRLVVCSYNGSPANVSVINADGSNIFSLTDGEEVFGEPPWDLDPSWSPDGGRIVFRSNREDSHPVQCDASDDGCNFELYVIEPEATNEIRLTFTPEDERSPAWSPDGAHIAYSAGWGGKGEIYVIDVDLLQVRNPTNSPGDDWDPAWSPDGRRIAFYSNRDGNDEIYVMNADGSGVTRLTDHPASDYDPVWQP
jgi:Tol biopolymer transport system component